MFSQVVERTWRDNTLFSVLIELTYKCNLDCYYCYNDLSLQGVPLSKSEYFCLFEDLSAMGVLNLTLSGGEPLAHPDFLDLGRKARSLGFVIRVKSNGHSLRGSMARRIKQEIDPFVVEVSLHGASCETHDQQTRVPGSFDRLLVNLREAAGLGLRIRLNCTLTRWNEHQVEQMYQLADRLGLPLKVDPEVSPRDDGAQEPLAITASRAGVLRMLEIQAQRAAALSGPAPITRSKTSRPVSDKHCGAGSSGLAIDPFGNVLPCVQWRRPVGNLRKARIGEIWGQSSGLVEVRRLSSEVKTVVEGLGKSGRLMAFCPGTAEAQTGSPTGVYAAARRRAELLTRVLDGTQPRSLPVLG